MSLPCSRRSRAAALALLSVAALSAACGRHDARTDAKPEDVDQKAQATPTEAEEAAFKAPADSMLTDKQVGAYLQVALLQFDLVRKEAPQLHESVAGMDQRAKSGGVLNGFRNVMEGATTAAHMTDLIGGSYVRASRTLHYNPAEMEWVRERMNEAGAYLMAKPMLAAQVQIAQQMRQQADQMGTSSGMTADQVAEMKKNADDMAANAQGNNGQARHVISNADLLRRVRPAVSEAQWTQVALFGGASGMAAFLGLADPKDTEAQKKLNEVRNLFQATLDNRLIAGMEDKKPEGDAQPAAPAAAPSTAPSGN
jgi:hypothetical protein